MEQNDKGQILDAIKGLENRLETRFQGLETGFQGLETGFQDICLQVQELATHMDRRFDQYDKKFVLIDKRFDSIDERFMSVDHRFNEMENKLLVAIDGVDKKVDRVAEKLYFKKVIAKREMMEIINLNTDVESKQAS